MTRGHGAVMGLDIRDRLFTRLNGLEEILHVVAGRLAFVEFHDRVVQVLLFRVRHVVDRCTLQLAAIDEDTTLGTLQEDSVVELDVVSFELVVDTERRAVGEFQIDVELAGGVVPVGQCNVAVQESFPIEIVGDDSREFTFGSDFVGDSL